MLQKLSFKRKILIYEAVISSLSLLLAVAAFVTYDFITVRQSLVNKINTEADILGKVGGSALVFYDRNFAEKLLEGLDAEPHVLAACIYGRDGAIFAQYSREKTDYKFPTAPEELSHQFIGKYLNVFRPVQFDNEQVGIIFIRSDSREITERLKRYAGISFSIMILSLFAALLFSIWPQRALTRSVDELEQTAKQISEDKDYSLRAVKYGEDELGILADAFNEMLSEIQYRDNALQESEERYDLAMSVASDGIWDWNLDTNTVHLDSRYYMMLGYEPNEFPSTLEETEKMFHPDDVQPAKSLIDQYLAGEGEVYDSEFRFLRKDGDYMWIRSRGKIVDRDVNGKPTRFIGTHSDITERKLAEEALQKAHDELEQRVDERTVELQKSEERLRTIIDIVPSMIFVRNAKGRFLTANKALSDSLGMQVDEIVGKKHADVHPDPDEVRRMLEDDRRVLESGCAIHVLSESYIDSTGTRRWLETIKSPCPESVFGEPTIVGLAIDITERRQTEEQLKVLVGDLERINAELQNFAYIISHDLKAPLRGISSLANWLAEDYTDVLDKTGREYLNKLLYRTKRMHNLIDGILQYSRIGRMEVETEHIESDVVVYELINLLLPPESIEVKVAGTLPPVIYDKTLLIQVFQNLIENAIRHLDKPKGEVVISCADQGAAWEFCVKDNGVGIEERHFERIFKIFQTLKKSTDTKSTGIGLSLVKKIVERCNGAIWVNSTVGKGSAFYFTIPKQSELKTLRKEFTVLIIDDNVEFIDIATTMLELEGHNVLYAKSGPEAYQILETHPAEIHIALFDVLIPGEDALERLKKLRMLRPEMKTVVCTGDGQSDIVRELEKESVDGLLTKPLRIQDLYRILKDITMPHNQKGGHLS